MDRGSARCHPEPEASTPTAEDELKTYHFAVPSQGKITPKSAKEADADPMRWEAPFPKILESYLKMEEWDEFITSLNAVSKSSMQPHKCARAPCCGLCFRMAAVVKWDIKMKEHLQNQNLTVMQSKGVAFSAGPEANAPTNWDGVTKEVQLHATWMSPPLSAETLKLQEPMQQVMEGMPESLTNQTQFHDNGGIKGMKEAAKQIAKDSKKLGKMVWGAVGETVKDEAKDACRDAGFGGDGGGDGGGGGGE